MEWRSKGDSGSEQSEGVVESSWRTESGTAKDFMWEVMGDLLQ